MRKLLESVRHSKLAADRLGAFFIFEAAELAGGRRLYCGRRSAAYYLRLAMVARVWEGAGLGAVQQAKDGVEAEWARDSELERASSYIWDGGEAAVGAGRGGGGGVRMGMGGDGGGWTRGGIWGGRLA